METHTSLLVFIMTSSHKRTGQARETPHSALSRDSEFLLRDRDSAIGDNRVSTTYRTEKPMRYRSPRACFPRDLWLIGCVLPMPLCSNGLHAGDSHTESWYGSQCEGESTDLPGAT